MTSSLTVVLCSGQVIAFALLLWALHKSHQKLLKWSESLRTWQAELERRERVLKYGIDIEEEADRA